MANILNQDPVAKIATVFSYCEKFDDLAEAAVRTTHMDPHKLRPNQAEKVVAIAAKKFGDLGALGTFKILKDAFIDIPWFGSDRIFPKTQLTLIRSLTDLPNVDFKTALYVLKQLKLYRQGDRDTLIPSFVDTFEKDQPVFKGTKITSEMLFEPIQRFGDRYGQKAAEEVVAEARNHYYMHFHPELRDEIEKYFREKFGDASADAIKPKLKYYTLNWIADLLAPSDVD